jgi:hypothetical protein
METTFASFLDEPTEPPHQQPRRSLNRPHTPKVPKNLQGFEPDKDLKLWLRSNAPRSWQELKDLRYCLYHRCNRADFKVKRDTPDYFVLTGRAGSVTVVSNSARHFVLWQLRLLARKKGWVGKRRQHNALSVR